MNWKAVLHLIKVDMKSGRLIRGQRLIKYNVKKSMIYTYLYYAIAIAIGLGVGFFVGYLYNIFSTDTAMEGIFSQYFNSFLIALPTLVLVYTLVFTMLQQIQRSGARFVRQIPYWLPVTWQEHTLASILAEILGFPLISISFIASALIVSSFYIGHTALTIGSILAMVASAFIASATTETFRVLQVRFTGAVYKSTGRAAIWVRLVSSLVFFLVFYIIYFTLISGTNSLIFVQTVAAGQSSVWFVPFVWLGLTLYSLSITLWLNGVAYLIGAVSFIIALYLLATHLNKRFALYEPPAITISRGIYKPKTGILDKLGFSSVQAALIYKDLKSFTRRRELIFVFILPIIFIIIPIMSGSAPADLPLFWFAYMTLFPTVIMSMSLGSFMTGEEGQSIWRIYISPISAKDYVKSKYTFLIFFSLIVLSITTIIGIFIYNPSQRAILVMVAESIFMAFSIGALSLSNGIKGADFNEIPRPRMMRPAYSLINLLTCTAVALILLVPFIPYFLSTFVNIYIGGFLDLYVATVISGVIAIVLTVVFYKIAEGNATELLTKAEL